MASNGENMDGGMTFKWTENDHENIFLSSVSSSLGRTAVYHLDGRRLIKSLNLSLSGNVWTKL